MRVNVNIQVKIMCIFMRLWGISELINNQAVELIVVFLENPYYEVQQRKRKQD